MNPKEFEKLDYLFGEALFKMGIEAYLNYKEKNNYIMVYLYLDKEADNPISFEAPVLKTSAELVAYIKVKYPEYLL